MSRITRLAALVIAAGAFQVAAAAPTGMPASEDARTADIHGSVPDSGRKPVIFHAPALTYDNGALITHPGGGPGGADASRLQSTSLGMTTLGFTASDTGAFRLSDDFTTTAPGWTINTITYFGYQTGSTTTSTFDVVRHQIWANGAPNGGGAVIFGDTTTNRFGSSAFTNIYRDTETTVANNQRPIMATTSAAIGLTFGAGTYWLDYQLGGTLASGPFSPPTTILGQTSGSCSPNCNGLQWNGTAWAALDDGAAGVQAQDVRFIIDYVPSPVELQTFQVD